MPLSPWRRPRASRTSLAQTSASPAAASSWRSAACRRRRDPEGGHRHHLHRGVGPAGPCQAAPPAPAARRPSRRATAPRRGRPWRPMVRTDRAFILVSPWLLWPPRRQGRGVMPGRACRVGTPVEAQRLRDQRARLRAMRDERAVRHTVPASSASASRAARIASALARPQGAARAGNCSTTMQQSCACHAFVGGAMALDGPPQRAISSQARGARAGRLQNAATSSMAVCSCRSDSRTRKPSPSTRAQRQAPPTVWTS